MIKKVLQLYPKRLFFYSNVYITVMLNCNIYTHYSNVYYSSSSTTVC
jgi:hypothetical protein